MAVYCVADGYSDREIVFQWEKRADGGVAIPSMIRELPQYNLTGVITSASTTSYVAGTPYLTAFIICLAIFTESQNAVSTSRLQPLVY